MKVLNNILPYPLSALTVTSVDGTNYGDTLIAVTGGTGDLYYKVGATAQAVTYLQPISAAWGAYTPGDITATTGQIITVVDVDAQDRAFAIGTATIDSRDVELSIAEHAKVLDNLITTIPYATTNDKAGVEDAILALINKPDPSLIATGFTASMSGTYVSPTWTGKITVVDDDMAGDSTTDATNRTLTLIATPNVAATKLSEILEADVNPVANGTDLEDAEAVIAQLTSKADTDVGAGYTASVVAGYTYDVLTKVFTGKFRVVDDAQALAYAQDAASRAYTITAAE